MGGHHRRRRSRSGDSVLHGGCSRHDQYPVLEKGWLGGGNTGRNTTIIRSNYLWDESAAIYEHALKLWEGLAQDLNFNIMFSQRGVLTIAHSEHELREMSRRVHAIKLNGIDSDVLGPEEIKAFVPIINI